MECEGEEEEEYGEEEWDGGVEVGAEVEGL